MIPRDAVRGTDELERTPTPDAATDELVIFPLVSPASATPMPGPGLDSSGPVSDPFETAAGPREGDFVLGFELVTELGRGAFARVFLAREMALSDRLVVLKLSYQPSGEAERLALLRHPNVVPVYSVHRCGALQVICMPYLGRTTLADLLIADDFARASADGDLAGGSELAPGVPNPVRRPAAVLRVLAGLAAGLQHAHACGILHLDIKPANVLLAENGEPLLFDFNLSLDATRGDREPVGGTKPYMPIEQMPDLASGRPARVDARADLYALGVTAFELLTGALPFPLASCASAPAFATARLKGPPSLRALNPAVPPAVDAIVRKLLAPYPAHRYQSAADLLEDVNRHLADLPLKHAPNPSWGERFGKWRRRNPWMPARLFTASALALALLGGAVADMRHAAAVKLEAAIRACETAKALAAARLDLLLPDPVANERGLRTGAAALAAYGLPERADWRASPAVRRLSAEARATTEADLGELMAVLAHAKWRAASGQSAAERRAAAEAAWELNAAARGCFAPGAVPFLDRQAAELAPHAGREFEPPPPVARADASPRAAYLDALEDLTRGRFGTAAERLETVVAADPLHAAAQFALALCRHQRGEHHVALERYKVAAALLPADPRPAFRRAQVYGTLGDAARAEGAFSEALARDPKHADALLYRAQARQELARRADPAKWAAAEADASAALECGAAPVRALFLRANVRNAMGNVAGARADHAAARARPPASESDFLARGAERLASDPKGALADFRAATERNPFSFEALYRQVQVLDRLGDTAGALATAERIVKLYPELAPARAGLAVLLARTGRAAEARAEVERALALSADPETTYVAACALAVLARSDPADRAPALALVKRALRDGFRDAQRLAADPDLSALADDPDLSALRELLARAAR